MLSLFFVVWVKTDSTLNYGSIIVTAEIKINQQPFCSETMSCAGLMLSKYCSHTALKCNSIAGLFLVANVSGGGRCLHGGDWVLQRRLLTKHQSKPLTLRIVFNRITQWIVAALLTTLSYCSWLSVSWVTYLCKGVLMYAVLKYEFQYYCCASTFRLDSFIITPAGWPKTLCEYINLL